MAKVGSRPGAPSGRVRESGRLLLQFLHIREEKVLILVLRAVHAWCGVPLFSFIREAAAC